MKRRMFVVFALSVVTLTAACVMPGCSSSSPAGADDVVPVADLALTPAAGTILTDVLCDASGSTIPSRALECRWDFESDGTWDTAWNSDLTMTHRFAGGDTFAVTVKIANGDATHEAATNFVVDNRHGHELSAVHIDGTGPNCMAFDGTYMWRTDWAYGTIYKTDPATGTTIHTYEPPSNWPSGIAWDGASLWLTDNLGGMRMFELDPATCETLSSFPVGGSSYAGGLAWDGTYFYHGACPLEGFPGNIRKYTRQGDFVVQLPPPRGTHRVQGLAHDGENLWVAVADVDTLYAVDPTDGSVRFTTPAQDLLYGVAVDDEGSLWVHRTGAGYHLAQIVP